MDEGEVGDEPLRRMPALLSADDERAVLFYSQSIVIETASTAREPRGGEMGLSW